MRLRYRIIQTGKTYYAQYKLWWFPFWIYFNLGGESKEEALQRINEDRENQVTTIHYVSD